MRFVSALQGFVLGCAAVTCVVMLVAASRVTSDYMWVESRLQSPLVYHHDSRPPHSYGSHQVVEWFKAHYETCTGCCDGECNRPELHPHANIPHVCRDDCYRAGLAYQHRKAAQTGGSQ